MTAALTCYSAVFMRYALAVSPKNYLLFGCHVVNCSAQITQGYRFLNYWKFGGREASLEQQAKQGLVSAKAQGKEGLEKAKEGAINARDTVVGEVEKAVGK
jgi:hypothetical protein